MKPTLITIFLLASIPIVKAQNQDTTVYKSFRLKSDTVRRFAEEPAILLDALPKYPGGQKKFHQFLSKNIKYPSNDGDITGKVWVQFIVEKDGHLSNIQLVRSLSPKADAEALRVMKLCPKWRPAMENDRPVRVLFFMPISFALK